MKLKITEPLHCTYKMCDYFVDRSNYSANRCNAMSSLSQYAFVNEIFCQKVSTKK